MEIEAWLQSALADAERRGLPGLTPLLTNLARATEALRRAECEAITDHAPRLCSGRPDPSTLLGVAPSLPRGERESKDEPQITHPNAGRPGRADD